MIEDFEKYDGGASDAALIGLVGSAFDEGRRGREAQDVLARGRQLRRRKRALPALSALGVVAASVSLAVALTGPSGADSTTNAGSSGHSLAGNGTVVNVDNAAFSVHTDVKTGKVAVTIRQYGDEGELKQILAKAGIRTVFITVTVPVSAHESLHISVWSCTWLGAKPLSESGVVQPPTPAAPYTFTIDPSKMPSGSVLAFQFEDLTLANGTPHGVAVTRQLLSGEPTGCTTK